MSLAFYFDVHVPKAIATALRARGVDLMTAQEDNTVTLADSDLLDHATQLGRVIVTFDEDFLAEAHRRQASNIPFAGAVFAKPTALTIGAIVRDLHLIALAGEPPELNSHVEYLPL